MERSTIFDGKIHYFDWAMFNSYVNVYQRVPQIIQPSWMTIFALQSHGDWMIPPWWNPWKMQELAVLNGWGIATGDNLPWQAATGAVAAGEHFHFVHSPAWQGELPHPQRIEKLEFTTMIHYFGRILFFYTISCLFFSVWERKEFCHDHGRIRPCPIVWDEHLCRGPKRREGSLGFWGMPSPW